MKARRVSGTPGAEGGEPKRELSKTEGSKRRWQSDVKTRRTRSERLHPRTHAHTTTDAETGSVAGPQGAPRSAGPGPPKRYGGRRGWLNEGRPAPRHGGHRGTGAPQNLSGGRTGTGHPAGRLV